MRLSPLQKFILVEVYANRNKKTHRKLFNRFYQAQKKRPKPYDIQNIITKSIERLIDRELLMGYGRRTSRKWFIDEVNLTNLGRRIAKTLLGEQQTLPFNKRRKK
ncbi:hypothetical protein KKG41_05275 [Patescibacteria group bacterium]|nr:hypothetical protein [Patescibacteria group bacterium]MBU1890947.1 hypothetical protein [Patescibacteria group bacterium]